jgi:hypothetical protein
VCGGVAAWEKWQDGSGYGFGAMPDEILGAVRESSDARSCGDASLFCSFDRANLVGLQLRGFQALRSALSGNCVTLAFSSSGHHAPWNLFPCCRNSLDLSRSDARSDEF